MRRSSKTQMDLRLELLLGPLLKENQARRARAELAKRRRLRDNKN